MINAHRLKVSKDKKNLYLAKPELSREEKRQIALRRAAELKSKIKDYLDIKDTIPCGLEMQEDLKQNKGKILHLLGGREEDWNSWKWQMGNRITTVEALARILPMSQAEKDQIFPLIMPA